MGILDWIFEDEDITEYDGLPVINISNEIWLAFTQEIIKWNEPDIYAFSFYMDYDIDSLSDLRLYFGYNTESQVEKEKCKDFDDETIRWNYNFWLQNETFCFGEDGMSRGLVKAWFKQQKIREYESVELFVQQVIYTVREIHKSGIIKEKFGMELPIIIHTMNYHDNIAKINIKANGELLDKAFIEYCK